MKRIDPWPLRFFISFGALVTFLVTLSRFWDWLRGVNLFDYVVVGAEG